MRLVTWRCKMKAFYKTFLFPVWDFTIFTYKKDKTGMIKYMWIKPLQLLKDTNNLKPEENILSVAAFDLRQHGLLKELVQALG